eukprot:SAG22_NODE_637_length_8315_cov_16.174416_7_plen_158_part_00
MGADRERMGGWKEGRGIRETETEIEESDSRVARRAAVRSVSAMPNTAGRLTLVLVQVGDFAGLVCVTQAGLDAFAAHRLERESLPEWMETSDGFMGFRQLNYFGACGKAQPATLPTDRPMLWGALCLHSPSQESHVCVLDHQPHRERPVGGRGRHGA